MPEYNESIGEPEGSQDTPMRNTTPARKRRPLPNPTTPPYKRPRKLNQCLTAHFLGVDIRALDRLIDADYDQVYEDMDKDMASLQKAADANDGILPLVETRKEKSRIARDSLNLLQEETKAAGPGYSEPANHEVPDFDDYRDDLVVDQCMKLHAERADEVRDAMENSARVKNMVVDFRQDLRRFHEAFTEDKERLSAEINSLEQKLNDKQCELDSRAKATQQDQMTEIQKILARQKQRSDEQTAALSRSHLKDLDDARQAGEGSAKKQLEQLEDFLYKTKQALREARQAQKKLEQKLQSCQSIYERDLHARQCQYEKLKTRWEEDQGKHKDLNHGLHQKLKEAEKLGSTHAASLITQTTRLHALQNEIRHLQWSFEGTVKVATTQMMQLDVARREKALLVGCLANTKSLLAGRANRLATSLRLKEKKIQQLENSLRRSNRQLDTKRALLKDYSLESSRFEEMKMMLESESHSKDVLLEEQSATLSIRSRQLTDTTIERDCLGRDLARERSLITTLRGKSSNTKKQIRELVASNDKLGKQMSKKDQQLKSDSARLEEYQSRIIDLVNTSTELEVQLKKSDKRIKSDGTIISGYTRLVGDLERKELETNEDLAAQRYTVTHKTQRIQELEGVNERLHTTIAQLTSDVAKKGTELDTRASKIMSHEDRLGKFESTHRTLLQEKAETERAMAKLAADLSKLKLDFNTKDDELTSQCTLVTQRDTRIRDLERAKKSLTTDKSDMYTRLEKLAMELTTKSEELDSQRISKDKKIEELGSSNAKLLRAQEDAEKDTAILQGTIQNANSRIGTLETTLSTRDEELRVAFEEAERVRSNLTNKMASLEDRLKIADEEVETLSKDFKNTKGRLEKKTSSLATEIERLDKENLLLSQEKDLSDKRGKELVDALSQTQVNIQDLEASKSTLIGQLEANRTLYDAIRLHYFAEDLPQDVVDVIPDTQDVRMFLGVQTGERVLVRVQRLPRERKAFVIIQRNNHQRTVWYESHDRCIVDMVERDWYLRLENAPSEAPIEVRFDDLDPYELEGWLKGSGVAIANGS